MRSRPERHRGVTKSVPGGRYHVSVDDVFESLFRERSASGSDADSDDLFAYLTRLNQVHGCSVDLYAFERGSVRGRRVSLSDTPESLVDEFRTRPWLRLAPHAECYELRPFEQSLDQQRSMLARAFHQIDRIAGSESRSRWLRLHYFSECYEMAPYLLAQGVESLLLTDKEDIAYRLDGARKEELQRDGITQHSGLALRRSFCRVENLLATGWDDARVKGTLRMRLSEHGYVALFTHESELERAEVRDALTRCVTQLEELGASPI